MLVKEGPLKAELELTSRCEHTYGIVNLCMIIFRFSTLCNRNKLSKPLQLCKLFVRPSVGQELKLFGLELGLMQNYPST